MAVRRAQALQVYKRLGLVVAVAVFCIYAVVNLTGPQGIPALFAKWKELREIEATNARLASDVSDRRGEGPDSSRKRRGPGVRNPQETAEAAGGEKLYQVPDPEPPASEPHRN
jgi:short subunit dehydrogenase-like uncharacterized protein